MLTADHIEEIEYWLEACEDEDDPIHRVECWRLERVPIAAFGCTFERSELGRGYNDADEDEREARIVEWAYRAGGWDKATRQSPVIALLDGGEYDKVDGWHRMKLAARDGESEVWCLVGVVPPNR